MTEEEIFNEALKKVTELACDVVEQCCYFADTNDYDKEWVIERFQEQFQRAKRDYLKR